MKEIQHGCQAARRLTWPGARSIGAWDGAFVERPQVIFDARCNHERAGSEYLAPPELVNNKHHRRGEVLRARFMESLHVISTRTGTMNRSRRRQETADIPARS